MSSTYIDLPPTGGSGSGAVDSVNGQTGVVVLTKSNIGLPNVDNTSDANKPISTATQTALNAKQNTIDGSNNFIVHKNGSGTVEGTPSLFLTTAQGYGVQTEIETDNDGTKQLNIVNVGFDPQQNSANDELIVNSTNVTLDPNDSGFTIGTNTRSVTIHNNSVSAVESADIGQIVFANNYANIGDGVTAIDSSGLSYSFGFANFNANVNIDGSVQGYGFQPSLHSSVTTSASTYFNPFYDSMSASGVAVSGYSSFTSTPTLGSIKNNTNLTSINVNPTVTSFTGNAGYAGLNLTGNLGTFDTGGLQGIYINPTASGVDWANGISIDMSNVAGSNVRAMSITGDVSITGALSFSGALSIGQLNAFYLQTAQSNIGGNPTTVHGLISGFLAPDSVTTANVDVIGVNTAVLITLEDDSVTTSGPLGIGASALALPCVVTTHTNSSLEHMNCAVYALSLDGTSTGGTIERVNLCRTEAIPNGITTIDELVAYEFNQSFGQVGTDVWGINMVPTWAQNHIGGSLNISGTNRKVTNSSVGIEIGGVTKAFLNARMTSTERDALTAVNGMQIYNSTTDKLQVYAAGSWVDLH